MRSSEIRRQSKETVSLDVLEKKLPDSCFAAVVNSLQDNVGTNLDESIYRRYFEAVPTPVLTEDEQKELFEQLGNNWVKNHYSTAELRALVDKPSVSSKSRRHE